MSARTTSVVTALVLMIGVLSPAHAFTREELVSKLEAAGYSQIGDVKTTPEGMVVKAMKNGREVSLSVDSGGQFREKP